MDHIFPPKRVFVALFFIFILAMASIVRADLTASLSGPTLFNQGDASPKTYTLSINNSGLTTAYGVGAKLELPAPGDSNGLTHGATIDWRVIGGGSGTVGASRSNGIVSALLPDIDLESGQTLEVDIIVDTRTGGSYGDGTRALGSTDTTNGQGEIRAQGTWSDSDGGGAAANSPAFSSYKTIWVEPGIIKLSGSPSPTKAAYGAVVNMEYTLENLGLGDIIDLDLSATAGFIGSGFGTAYDIQMTNPPQSFGTSFPTNLTIAAGEIRVFSFKVNVVQGCSTMTAELQALWPAAGRTHTHLNSAEFILQNPNIAYTNVDLNLGVTPSTPDTGSIRIQNNGAGPAQNLTIDTNLDGAALEISNVSAGWSYTTASGLFTYTGEVSAAAFVDLSFTATAKMAAGSPCTLDGSASGTYLWEPNFYNVCGEKFEAPVRTASYSITNLPDANVTVSGPQRVFQRDDVEWQVVPGFTGDGIPATETVTLTNTIPTAYESLAVVNPDPLNITASIVGNTVTFQGQLQYVTGQTFRIQGQVKSDASAGTTPSVVSAISPIPITIGSTTCSVQASDSRSTLIQSSPYDPNSTITQSKDMINPSTFNLDNGPYEFCTDPTVGIINSYDFGPGLGRTFSGSTLVENMGGSATIVSAVTGIEYTIDNTNWNPVPPANYAVNGPANDLSDITLDLGFLAGVHGVDDPANTTLGIRYLLTLKDSDGRSASTGPLARTDLTISPAAEATVQGVYLNLTRANLTLNLSGLGGRVVTQYETRPMTLTVNPTTAFPPNNVTVRINRDNYVIDVAPNVAGVAASVASTSGQWIIELAGLGDLTSTATITFDAQRKCGTGSLVASATFDDECPNTPTVDRQTSDVPLLQVEPDLDLFSTPAAIVAKSNQINHTLFVANSGVGAAHNVVLHEDLDPSLELVSYSIDGGVATPASGQTLAIDFATLEPNDTHEVALTLQFTGTGGCAGLASDAISAYVRSGPPEPETECQRQNASPPISLSIANSGLSVRNTISNVPLCGTGTITIDIRNVGATALYDLRVVERMLTSGLTVATPVANNARLQIANRAVDIFIGDKIVNGVDGGPTVEFWSSGANAIPELATLAIGERAIITINVQADGSIGDPANRTVNGRVQFNKPCSIGQSPEEMTNAPATAVGVTMPDPLMVLRVDVDSDNNWQTSRVADKGNSVRFRHQITNSNDVAAQYLRLEITRPAHVAYGTLSTNADGTGVIAPVTPGTDVYELPVPLGVGATQNVYYRANVDGCVEASLRSQLYVGCSSSSYVSAATADETAEVSSVPDVSIDSLVSSSLEVVGGQVTVRIRNAGATATINEILLTLPANFKFDDTQGPLSIVSDDANFSLAAQPTFGAGTMSITSSSHLNGPATLGTDKQATISYYILPSNTNYLDELVERDDNDFSDDSHDFPNTDTENRQTVQVTSNSLCYQQSVESRNHNNLIRAAQLDINIDELLIDGVSATGDLNREIVTGGETIRYRVRVRNNGYSGSVGDDAEVRLLFGAGFDRTSINVVAINKGFVVGDVTVDTGTGTVTVPPITAGIATGSANDFIMDIEVDVPSDPSTITGPLSLVGEVTRAGIVNENIGYSVSGDSMLRTPLANQYFQDVDQEQVEVVGFSLHKYPISRSSSQPFTLPTTLTIGEDVTYRIEASFFGMDEVSALQGQDTLPTGLDYQSADPAVSEISEKVHQLTNWKDPLSGLARPATIPVAGLGLVKAAVDLTARTENISGNQQGSSLVNEAQLQFTAKVGDSNYVFTPAGPVSTDPLMDSTSVTVMEPNLSISTLVRAAAAPAPGSPSTTGQAGGEYIYTIEVTNNGRAPAYNVEITDLVETGLNITPFATDGLDNDGHSGDGDAEGSVVSQNITWNFANTGLSTFNVLQPGETISLQYKVEAPVDSLNGRVFDNEAVVTYNSFSPANGETRDGSGGVNDYRATDEAILTITPIEFVKTFVTSSHTHTSGQNAAIGEIITYQLELTAYKGRTNDVVFKDTLPTGMTYVDTLPINVSDIDSLENDPPAFSAAGNALSWNFGDVVVTANSGTITLQYRARVSNALGVDDGDNLTNVATLEFDDPNAPGTPISLAAPDNVTVAVVEPLVNTTVSAVQTTAGTTGAGTIYTFTVEMSNPSGGATADAFDVQFRASVPAGVTIINGSLGGADTPDHIDYGAGTFSFDEIALDGTKTFTFQVQLNNDANVQPGVVLTTNFQTTWESLPDDATPGGGANDPRNGSGGVNDYATTDSFSTDVHRPTIQKVLNPDVDYRSVGEEATYQVTVELARGQSEELKIVDSLPDGLSFIGVNSTVSSAGVNTGSLSVTPAAPSAGNGDTLTFDYGTVTTGNSPTITYTIVLTYSVRVINKASNVRGAVRTNTAKLTYLDKTTATTTEHNATAPPGSEPTFIVREPELEVTKEMSPPVVTAGSTVQVKLTVNHAANSDADGHDIVINDSLPTEMSFAAFVATTLPPGTSFTRLSDKTARINITSFADGPPTNTLEIYYDVIVQASIQPNQTVANSVDMQWTSVSGSATDERTGSSPFDGLNDYNATASDTVQGVGLGLSKSVIGNDFGAPGDLVSFRLTYATETGYVPKLSLTDSLPAGLAFFDIVDVVRSNCSTERNPESDSYSSTGGANLLFDFGDVNVTTPGIPLIVDVDFRARVLNVASSTNGVSLDNSVVGDFGPGTPITGNTTSVTVVEPLLQINKLVTPTEVRSGDEVTYTISVSHTGNSSAPAYDLVVEDRLPTGLTIVDPASDGLDNDDDTSTDEAGEITQSAQSGYNLLTLNSDSLALGSTWTIQYKAIADQDLADGLILRNRADVRWDSQETDGTNPEERDGSDGSGGSPNSYRTPPTTAPVTIDQPDITITKVIVDENGPPLQPDDFVRYEITVTNGDDDSAASSVVVTDVLSEHLDYVPGSLNTAGDYNVTTPNTITANVGTINAASHSTVTFRAQIKKPLVNGTAIINRATVYTDQFSPRPSNEVNVPVESAPNFVLQKVAQNVTDPGQPLEAGDRIRYTLTLYNTGDEIATNTVLRDTVPPNTTYVADSMTVGGSAFGTPDGGTLPLIAGITATAPATAPAGNLLLDDGIAPHNERFVVTFDVTVDNTVAQGSIIANQAFVKSTEKPTEEPSDDPSTPEPGDPTRLPVGRTPIMDATKTVVISNDVNGNGYADAGDRLRYTVTLSNVGNQLATNVFFNDPIPTNTTYFANSITLDSGPLADASNFTAAPPTVAVSLPDMNAVSLGGVSHTITFDVTINGGTPAGTIISNQGSVDTAETVAEPTDEDGNDGNGDQPTLTPVGAGPALNSTKKVVDLNGGVVLNGDVLRYTIEVVNSGSTTANNVVVTDSPPAGTTYVAVSSFGPGAAHALPTLRWQGLDLAPGERVEVGFSVTVTATSGTINNLAAYGDGGLPDDDTNNVSVDVGQAPGVGSIVGRVFHDNDRDDVYSALTDTPEGRAFVELYNESGVLIDRVQVQSDGTFEFRNLPTGDVYSLRFTNANNTTFGQYTFPVSLTDGAQLRRDHPLDPSGIVYDAVTGVPISGATVQLLHNGGVAVPATYLAPGQFNQVTAADGFYRFDLQPNYWVDFGAGPHNFTLAVQEPSGYLTAPSVLIPPLAGPFDPTAAAGSGVVAPGMAPDMSNLPTSAPYYFDFTLENGDDQVVNNHIPLDPPLEGAILLRKRARKPTATIGDVVIYTIEARNTTAATLSDLEIHDTLPPGFRYVEGSVRVNGAPWPNAAGTVNLTFTGMTLNPDETLELVYAARVGTSTPIDRDALNLAFAQRQGFRVSNEATCRVYVMADPIFDLVTVMGKVFHDRNGDGQQDDGEEGIPGVAIYTAFGLRVVTDKFGRYHLAGMKPRTEAFKVDRRTLPPGSSITTENPRVVDLTRGLPFIVNFGVKLPPLVIGEESQGGVVATTSVVEGDITTGIHDPGANLMVVPLPEGFLSSRLNVTLENHEPKMFKGKLLRPLEFTAYTNYAHFIDRIRFELQERTERGWRSRFILEGSVAKLFETFSYDGPKDGEEPLKANNYFRYRLEVFDKNGRRDLTKWATFQVQRAKSDNVKDEKLRTPRRSYRRDHRIVRNINLRDAQGLRILSAVPVSINEKKPVPDHHGRVLDEVLVPRGPYETKIVDEDKEVYSQLLLPYPRLRKASRTDRELISPQHALTSAARKKVSTGSTGVLFVGLVDFTAGRSNSSLSFEQITENDTFNKKYPVKGRGAFFLKGKVKGKYLVTAMLDTQNELAGDILKRMDEKDPRVFLRHLDPDRYYPIYGDDSEAMLETNTHGRFFLKVQWNENEVKWGNYNTGVTDTELAKFVRSLYGAHVKLESRSRTTGGDAKRRLELFAADTATMASRNDFLGTGGSLYYLKHQYLVEGSAKVRVEIRDQDSGLVLERSNMTRGVDYEIDEYAGRITLARPLTSLARSRFLSNNGTLDGDRYFLVVEYEYLAPCGRIELGEIYGGRGTAWVSDRVRIGLTHVRDLGVQGTEEHQSADVKIRFRKNDYLTIQRATSETAGVGSYYSSDGGLSFRDGPNTATIGDDAAAWHYEYSRIDGDKDGEQKGTFRAYFQKFDQGYRASGYDFGEKARRFGVEVKRHLNKKDTVVIKHDDDERKDGRSTQSSRLQLHHQANEKWHFALEGQRRSDETTAPASKVSQTLVAGKATVRVSGKVDLFLRGQAALKTDHGVEKDNRVAIGASASIDGRTSLVGEVSTGNLGEGYSLGLKSKVGKDSELYGEYSLNTDAVEGGYRQTVWGHRAAIDGQTRVNVEDRYKTSDKEDVSSRVFGLERQLDQRSRFNVTVERGAVFSPTGGESERKAYSFGVVSRRPRTNTSLKLEFRQDEGASNREQFLLSTRLDKVLRKDFKAILKANLSDTRDSALVTDTTFSEITIGLAMRPRNRDMVNWLAKVSWLRDVASAGQEDENLAEKAMIFSIEGVKEINRHWSIAGKLATRQGSVKMFRDDNDYIHSRVDFQALRVNYHVNRQWDCYAEWRRLQGKDVGNTQRGWLVGVNRMIGSYKVGIGYNFTDFSDNMTNLDFDEEGWFFRAGVKF